MTLAQPTIKGKTLLWHNCHDGSEDDPFGLAEWWRKPSGPYKLNDRIWADLDQYGSGIIPVVNQPAGKLPRADDNIVSSAHVWTLQPERRMDFMMILAEAGAFAMQQNTTLGAYLGFRLWSHVDLRTPTRGAMKLPNEDPALFAMNVAPLAACGVGAFLFDLASSASPEFDAADRTNEDVRLALVGFCGNELKKLGAVACGEAIPTDDGNFAPEAQHAPWLANIEHLDRNVDPLRTLRAGGRTLFVHARSGDSDPREGQNDRPYDENDLADFKARGFGLSIGLTRTGAIPAKFRGIVEETIAEGKAE